MQAIGGTNLHDALMQAMALLTADQSSQLASMIVVLTDGQPTVGIQDTAAIVDHVIAKNADISINSLSFGDDADYELMKRISGRNRGLARKIYEDADAALQMAGK
jgi:Mg-chelatase subunit ChlD